MTAKTDRRQPPARRFIRSEQTRERMRIAHFGRKLSPAHKLAISKAMRKLVRDE
jgi:hypothetical protein